MGHSARRQNSGKPSNGLPSVPVQGGSKVAVVSVRDDMSMPIARAMSPSGSGLNRSQTMFFPVGNNNTNDGATAKATVQPVAPRNGKDRHRPRHQDSVVSRHSHDHHQQHHYPQQQNSLQSRVQKVQLVF